jgi:hypothetical protein
MSAKGSLTLIDQSLWELINQRFQKSGRNRDDIEIFYPPNNWEDHHPEFVVGSLFLGDWTQRFALLGEPLAWALVGDLAPNETNQIPGIGYVHASLVPSVLAALNDQHVIYKNQITAGSDDLERWLLKELEDIIHAYSLAAQQGKAIFILVQ